MRERINKAKICFYKKSNQISKSLEMIKVKKRKSNIHNINKKQACIMYIQQKCKI